MEGKVVETCLWVSGVSSSECASWVQAWGSIGAILVAVFIAWFTHWISKRAAAQAAEDQANAYRKICLLAVQEASALLSYIARRLEDRQNQRYGMGLERVESLHATFQALLQKDLPIDVIRGVLTVQRELSYTLMALEQLRRVGFPTEKRVSKAKRRYTIVAEILEQMVPQSDEFWAFDGPVFLRNPYPDEHFDEMELD